MGSSNANSLPAKGCSLKRRSPWAWVHPVSPQSTRSHSSGGPASSHTAQESGECKHGAQPAAINVAHAVRIVLVLYVNNASVRARRAEKIVGAQCARCDYRSS